ncbi:hypothetical protein ACEWPL_017980 [Roseovarius sp. S1116L3]|uniref:hypothetical protein n=1 Tax=Roseovarius roseus TaxID=3342636 RepID=UPI00372661CC
MRRITGLAGALLTPLCVAFVLFAVIIAAHRQHSIVLGAETTSLDVTFSAGENYWRVEGPVELCEFGAAGQGVHVPESACGPPLFRRTEIRGFEVKWPQGAAIRLFADHTGDMRVFLDSVPAHFEDLDGQKYSLQPGSFVKMDPDTARNAGLFAFLGTASMGRPAGPNETNFIYDGDYEVRLPVNRWFIFGSDRDVTVKSGALVRGHTAAIMRQGQDGPVLAEGFGHVALDRRDTGDYALSAVFVSAKGRAHLEVEQWGRSAPVVIRPNWIDVTLNSPFILGFLAIAALALSGAQVFYDALEALLDADEKNEP